MGHTFEPWRYGFADEADAELVLEDPAATRALGSAWAARAEAGDYLGLVGALGAGKTTLMQGVVAALSADEEATSPTYTLLNVYETSPPIFHFDLYRLDDVDDLETVGYWDYVESNTGLSCVEWLDRVPESWPGEGTIVVLERIDERRRARVWTSGEAGQLQFRLEREKA